MTTEHEIRKRLGLDGFPGLENPFTDEYLKQEIEFYNPKAHNMNGSGVALRLKPIKGFTRVDEYLNKQVRTSGPDIPILTIDGEIWMSLTWLEVQSHWLPVKTFGGDVLTGGLGMGYAALRFAADKDVDSVTVYETDERVIDFFRATQGHRAEQQKITVIHGDIHDATGQFDHAYIDIYQTLLPDELLEDAEFFCTDLHPKLTVQEGYHFWGQELAWLSLMSSSWTSEDLGLSLMERLFYGYWTLDNSKASLYRGIHDLDYCCGLAELTGRW